MELRQKNCFHEIDLFDFATFFGRDFFKFSGPLCETRVSEVPVAQCSKIRKRKSDLGHSGPENLKKSWQKNSWNEIKKKFFVKLHFWQSETFSQFKNWFLDNFEIEKKWNLAKKIFVKLILFDFASFFGLDFL